MDMMNLRRLSTISIAVKIWESPDIKHQIRQVFLSQVDRREPISVEELNVMEENFKLIIDKAVQCLYSIEVPPELLGDCLQVVQEMGKKVYDWTLHVTEELGFNFKFAQQIYWLPDGTIDKDKIINSWENDQEFLDQRNSEVLDCIKVLRRLYLDKQPS